MDLHFKTTWWRPLRTDPSLSLFLSVSLSASLSHAPFLSRSDRFIKRQGSKRVPSSLLSSSLAFSSSSSTDSISSLVSPSLSARPVARACILEPAEKNERNRRMRKEMRRRRRQQEERMSIFFFFPIPVACFKRFFPTLSLTHTCHFLSFSTHEVVFFYHLFKSVYFQQTSGGDFFIYFFFVGE